MKIQPFKSNPNVIAELVDLILYCQNIEAGLGIPMAEQPDVFEIPDYYQNRGGQFWVSFDDDGHVAGCIGLLRVTDTTAVLKKFFVYPQFRGRPVSLGWQLYQTLLEESKHRGFQRLVLDTPEGEHRSHRFYERQGFVQCSYEDLGVEYAFPDRDSRFYQLTL